MTKITGRDKRVADWLEKIGIVPNMTSRVVIDIPANGAVRVYIEQFGDSSMFEVEPPPELTTAIKIKQEESDIEEAVQLLKDLNTRNPVPSKVKGADEPTPEWLAEFEAKQRAAIQKWERPGD